MSDDGFSETETLLIAGFIHDNLLDAFAELVTTTYSPKQRGHSVSFIFYIELHSKYTGKEHPVYFGGKDNEVYVFNDSLTDTRLEDYIADYFSPQSNNEQELSRIRCVLFSEKSLSEKQEEINIIASTINEKTRESHGFVKGAITFLDFLAWKGLWQKQAGDKPLEEVSKLIESFRLELDRLSSKTFDKVSGIPLSSLISISDTIAVFTPKTSKIQELDLIRMHAEFSKYVLEECAKKKYPIRGAITVGEYSFIKSIMIGPGIDECASWHETGDWIGVHLTPSAELYVGANAVNEFICSYRKIPLKQGLQANYCVKWYITKEEFLELAFKNQALVPEIAGKYMNTRAFLQCTAWTGGECDGKE